MKRQLFIGLLVAGALLSARAGIIYTSSDAPQTIDPIGITSTIDVSGAGSSMGDVTVTLNASGGYNGSLYAYLSYNGTLVQLLNQVGTGSGDAIQQTFGFSTSGFNNVTLSSDAGSSGNIHDVATPGSSPAFYAPDGGDLASFTGNPNGTWTIFFADMTAGGGTSTLEGWSLDITVVPEPVNVALAIFGGLLGVWRLGQRRHKATAETTLD